MPLPARCAGAVCGRLAGAAGACPTWVQFTELSTGLPYFYNVLTHERANYDPDPQGKDRVQHEAPADAADPWRRRPARVQKVWDPTRAAYTEGNEDFNVWFGRYESDRFDPKDREPASTCCDPEQDSGYTQADLMAAVGGYFCIFFARGCCYTGHRCNYYHHVPTVLDSFSCDAAHDIFGRERFASHRDDMGGVGSFNSNGLTLFVGDLRFDRAAPDAVQTVERLILDRFGAWGDVDAVRIIPAKAIGFVKYTHRAAAEFAKMAMDNQKLGLSPHIRVRWANDDPNPRTAKRARIERQDIVDEALNRTALELGLSDVDLAGIALANQPNDFHEPTAPYPDTSAQYLARQTSAVSMWMGPPTNEEIHAEAARLDASANLDRMTAVLARIDAMHEGAAQL